MSRPEKLLKLRYPKYYWETENYRKCLELVEDGTSCPLASHIGIRTRTRTRTRTQEGE